MRERAAAFAIVFAGLALIAGCGGDDAPIQPVTTESTGSSAASLSRDDFIVSADARCGEANVAIANLTSGTVESAGTVSQELEITQGVLDGLQGLGTAEDPDGSLGDFYAALEDQIRILTRQQSALASADTATASSLETDLDAARSAGADAAPQYGFEECGQQGSTLAPGGTSTSVTPAPPATEPLPTTTAPAPTPIAPVTPVEPAPVTPPPPPTGGTGGGTATPPSGGGSSGSSGGISPG